VAVAVVLEVVIVGAVVVAFEVEAPIAEAVAPAVGVVTVVGEGSGEEVVTVGAFAAAVGEDVAAAVVAILVVNRDNYSRKSLEQILHSFSSSDLSQSSGWSTSRHFDLGLGRYHHQNE